MNAQDIEEFWTLVALPFFTMSDSLQEDVPKAVCNSHQQVNSIQKCLWILRTKFRFISTQKLKFSGLTSVGNTPYVPQQLQFPTTISIHSKCAVYDHVVVVLQGQVLDYESEVIHVTPHMVTNYFQERGLPIWDFFVPRPVPALGLPVWLRGLVFLPSSESWVRRRAT
jgi:hypothetical protein